MDGKQLTQRREALGLSYQQLAEAVGVPRSTIWRIEVDGRRPGPLTVRAIEAALSRLEADAAPPVERVGVT